MEIKIHCYLNNILFWLTHNKLNKSDMLCSNNKLLGEIAFEITWLSTTGDVAIQALSQVSDDARPLCYLNRRDASVQFDYLVLSSGKSIKWLIMIPSLSDHLYGVHIAEKKLFYIQGNGTQSLYWEEYGLRIHISQNTLSSSEICEVAVTVLVGGHFKFPNGSVLVSAIYDISIAKPLLQPLKLEIQHC